MSYLGQGLGLGREERFTATATAGQTTVTVGDDGRSISYTPNYVDVYLNGVKMVNGSDITVTSGTSIVFASALSAGDSVDVVAPGYFQPADTVSRSLGGTFLGPVNFPSGGLNVGSGQLQVDSSGRVLMNSQPAFVAHCNTNDQGGTNNKVSNAPVIFTGVKMNRGGSYNTSTGRFTAPVAGLYEFSFHSNLNTSTMATWFNVVFAVSSGDTTYHYEDKLTTWQFVAFTNRFYLNAGDYVYVNLSCASGTVGCDPSAPWSRFEGHLIG